MYISTYQTDYLVKHIGGEANKCLRTENTNFECDPDRILPHGFLPYCKPLGGIASSLFPQQNNYFGITVDGQKVPNSKSYLPSDKVDSFLYSGFQYDLNGGRTDSFSRRRRHRSGF